VCFCSQLILTDLLKQKNFSKSNIIHPMRLCIKTLFFLLFFSLIFLPKITFAHSGRTDAYGCHNCYTSACYGEYHCHGGGGGYIPSGPTYLLSKPENPTNGNWTYSISSDNWCNYDLVMTWDKSLNGDRYSIASSKYAGANPGPLVDTTGTSFIFKNLTPGRWYINIKTGNYERWSDISYWTIDLPKPTPSINAYISKDGNNQYLNYEISCLKTVEGPSEFINYLDNNGKIPKGKVLLNYNYPTTINMKGWDKNNKEYSQNIPYYTIPTPLQTNNDNSSDFAILILIIICLSSIFVGYKFIKWFINYAKSHDWVYTALFYLIIITIIIIYSIFS